MRDVTDNIRATTMFSTGSRLGPYEIGDLLGTGGMGEVYRARDPRLGRDVAIKVLTARRNLSLDQLHRFDQEARAAAALSHPNILSVLDVGTHDRCPYVVFELLEGETLRDRLRRGPLPPRKALEIAIQLCEGLAAAHNKGIVHRDLKPENVFLTRSGQAKILDFGVAKLTQPLTEGELPTRADTANGLIVGTIAYMSPEQVRGHRVDSRSDVFALGATLYEMFSGHPAFQRATAAATVAAILDEDLKPIAASAEQPVPPGLDTVLSKCLEKEPYDRFQSARDLGFALTAILNAISGSGTTVRSSLRPFPKPAWLVLVLGLIAVALWTQFRQTRVAQSSAPLTLIPFTSFAGQEIAPSFSPDGSQIAFAWSPEGPRDQFDLYTKVTGSENPLRLTQQPADFMYPAWSPDGRQIAFARAAPHGGGIYLISSLGGPERKLVDGTFDYFLEAMFSWSPDGKLLAFRDQGPSGQFGVSLLEVATLQKHWLGSPSPECVWSWVPVFSPDGGSLAAACMLSYGVNDLFVWPVSGGNGRHITRVRGDFAGMTWGTDGTSVIFAADGDLWRITTKDGTSAQLLVGQHAGFPAISRDGRRLAYTSHSENANIWQVSLAGRGRAAGLPAKVISSSRIQKNPAISPDGRRVAFESNRSGSLEIWTSALDGSNATAVTSVGAAWTGSPRWSPDGRSIALDSRAEGRTNIYIVPSQGGPLRRVSTGLEDSSEPEWSIDGRWLYFAGKGPGREEIFKVPVEGGIATQLTAHGGLHPRVSPSDPARIYFHNAERGMCSVTPAGTDERCLSEFPRLRPAFYAGWAICDGGVYVVNAAPEKPGIDFFDVGSARTVRVTDLTAPPAEWASLEISPDCGRLLYSQVDATASDIMIIENFGNLVSSVRGG